MATVLSAKVYAMNKTVSKNLGLVLAGLGVWVLALVSCDKFPSKSEKGSLSWRFNGMPASRAAPVDIPDTDDFILEVMDVNGKVLYKGKYGASPESIDVEPGNYSIRVRSRDFSSPEFSAPQFGDEQVVSVVSGASTKAKLSCSQLNSGLRLVFSEAFPSDYPGGKVKLSSPDGTLDYAYSEKRIAYFRPGSVSATLSAQGTTTQLLTRNLEPCEILTIGLSGPSLSGGGSSGGNTELGATITVDTSRVWNSEDFTVGSEDDEAGGTKASAYGVSQAKRHVGEKGVWIVGYIVGGDLSSKEDGISFSRPFVSNTNIAIASRSNVSSKSSCMSVQLQKGKFRDALNLVDNPGLLGRKVYLKGSIVDSYFGLPGIQSISDFEVK